MLRLKLYVILTKVKLLLTINLHYQYCKDNPNETQPTLEKLDDYLYRWVMKVWPRALNKIQEYSRNKHAQVNFSFKDFFCLHVQLLT